MNDRAFQRIIEAVAAASVGLGGKGSGHWGHAGVKGKLGGSAPGQGPDYQVGITSHRGKPEGGFKPEHLDEFRQDMSKTPAKGVSVYLGRGGWQGGWEPTFVTQYSGNGDAVKALARFGKKYNQTAILIQRYAKRDEPNVSPQVRLQFGGSVTKGERAAIEKRMGELGIGGWTWAKQGGRRSLMLTCVPQWGGNGATHNQACSALRKYLKRAGHPIRSATRSVRVTIMERGNYDDFINGGKTAD